MGMTIYRTPVELFEEDTGTLWEYTAVVEREHIPPNPGTWESDLDYYGVDDSVLVGIEDIHSTQKVLTFSPETGRFHYQDVEKEWVENMLDEKIVELLYKHAEGVAEME